MQKRHLMWLCLILLVVVVGVWPTAAQSRSVVWERWDVVIDNVDTTTNIFDVAEIYDVRFIGSFTFGSVLIPMDRIEEIRDVRVYEAEELLTASCNQESGTYCVQNTQEGQSILYYFNRPIANVTQSFRIEYTVVGALRVYEGGDQLWWTAIPSDHFGFPIRSSTVTVELPPDYAPREGIDPVVTYGVPADVSVNGTIVVATVTREIQGNESFDIRIQYPHDPNARKPLWQEVFDEARTVEERVLPLLNLGAVALSLMIIRFGVSGG